MMLQPHLFVSGINVRTGSVTSCGPRSVTVLRGIDAMRSPIWTMPEMQSVDQGETCPADRQHAVLTSWWNFTREAFLPSSACAT